MTEEMIRSNITSLEKDALVVQDEINQAQNKINEAKLRFKTNGERMDQEEFKNLRDVIRIKTTDMHTIYRKIKIERNRLREIKSKEDLVTFKRAAKILLDNDLYNKIIEMASTMQQEDAAIAATP